MNALIIKEDGLIYVNEVPDHPCEQLPDHDCPICQGARDTAVLCADQEQAREILFVRRCIFPKEIALKQATGIYPIEGLKFEVKEELYMDNAFRSRKVANLSLEEK